MKINFDREETYEKMLEKCQRIVWKDYTESFISLMAQGPASSNHSLKSVLQITSKKFSLGLSPTI